MGLVKLRIKEFADEKGWTLKELSDRSGIAYTTVKNYAKSRGLATVDLTSLDKLARTFEVLIEDLYEVVRD
jgi:transcriptional regulator with XRE-family HTH domain